jgi:hypothetical protein
MNVLGRNSQRRSSDEIFDTIKVRCQTLDTFCIEKGVDHIDILKIDVEGAELAVLEGAREMLKTGRVKHIQVEILDKKESHEEKARQVIEMLEGFGYRLEARRPIRSVGILSDIRADDALFVHDGA